MPGKPERRTFACAAMASHILGHLGDSIDSHEATLLEQHGGLDRLALLLRVKQIERE